MPLKFVRGIYLGYKLPKSLRKDFRKPIGHFFTGPPLLVAENVKKFILNHKPPLVISIGDYCTKTLFQVDFYPNIVIYDGKTLRTNNIILDLDSYSSKTVINPSEWITQNAWETIKSSISFCTSNKDRVSVRVEGEEDLLAIPAIISSPLESIIIYGQPPITTEAGIVCVITTRELRKRMQELLEKFDYHEEFTDGN